jgi:dolichyl-phosphate-mannose-protein mannosyltransferase
MTLRVAPHPVAQPASAEREAAPVASPARPRRPLNRWLVPLVLVLAVPVTRAPFMTQTLYAFDSANYALAVARFYNVAFHQPHPPGYPVYVAVARALNAVVQDANRALVLESVLWSMVAVACSLLLAQRLYGRPVGLLSSFLLCFTVGFWGYGEVAYPYVALAGETASLALLAHLTLSGRPRMLIPLGVVWAVAAGVRWDAAVFCAPLWLWALWSVRRWSLGLASVGLAGLVVVAWAVPMIWLTGGWDVYRAAVSDYLKVWSPQSAFVVGDYASGGETQAGYNLNFLVNYLRQMLGVGLLLVPYLLGRRFGPGSLATDARSRFLLVWTMPPLLVYVFAHLGEPGYVLSLAPQAAILAAVAIEDLGRETSLLARVLAARRWRLGVGLANLGPAVAGLLIVAIVGWNVQAFLRGVGPGRLPDLRAHDLTTSAQVAFLRTQSPATTLVLAHDILRQVQYYLPDLRVDLLYSEYVPNFEQARSQTDVPAGVNQVVVLDSPLQIAPEDGSRMREVLLREQPRVSVWVVDVRGARAVEHGYRYVKVLPI